jgi:hypothetical protein
MASFEKSCNSLTGVGVETLSSSLLLGLVTLRVLGAWRANVSREGDSLRHRTRRKRFYSVLIQDFLEAETAACNPLFRRTLLSQIRIACRSVEIEMAHFRELLDIAPITSSTIIPSLLAIRVFLSDCTASAAAPEKGSTDSLQFRKLEATGQSLIEDLALYMRRDLVGSSLKKNERVVAYISSQS